ncbi:hypothetical protein [Rhodococcoides kyotonense]|uniref:Uncharacterized protein n=1 Tax=Rhodococcoides kyotonense TaxID=398843 RepID=A0A239G7X8_9NOCA|nr:hypothetical protein [Rhodococcus kyotonensis]SNS64812.1 hypothetical protein SAMN05421642_10488 [Rhodococcus kyotonensis]
MFVVTGILFALYPILRPYSTETGPAGAEAFASPLWVAAHVCAMIGFLTLVLAVRQLADSMTPVLLIGVGLVLPYYGAETFALHELGREAQDTGSYALIDLAEPIRYGPTQTVMFGAGLILIAVATVLVARRIGGWQVYVFAAGFALFLPQFFLPPWLRVAHGLLILAGCLLVAPSAREPARQEISTTTGA